jgi:crossover junction endodeoxyribonuclease RusA
MSFELITLTLPFPPSVNGYWRAVKGRQIISKAGRDYRAAVVAQIMPMRLRKLTEKLRVDLVLCEPNNIRRDVDNWLKAPLDALTHAGLWIDDHQIDFLSVRRGEKTNRLVVTIGPADMAMFRGFLL